MYRESQPFHTLDSTINQCANSIYSTSVDVHASVTHAGSSLQLDLVTPQESVPNTSVKKVSFDICDIVYQMPDPETMDLISKISEWC